MPFPLIGQTGESRLLDQFPLVAFRIKRLGHLAPRPREQHDDGE